MTSRNFQQFFDNPLPLLPSSSFLVIWRKNCRHKTINTTSSYGRDVIYYNFLLQS